MATSQRYDLYSSDFRTTTHETYARMREQDPVLCQPGLDGETPIWFVTRYDDVVSVLLDDERFVLDPALALTAEELAALEAGSPFPVDDRVNTHLLTKDGGDHRRLRRLVTKAFTPRMSSSSGHACRRLPTSSSTAWKRKARWTSWRTTRSRCPSP